MLALRSDDCVADWARNYAISHRFSLIGGQASISIGANWRQCSAKTAQFVVFLSGRLSTALLASALWAALLATLLLAILLEQQPDTSERRTARRDNI